MEPVSWIELYNSLKKHRKNAILIKNKQSTTKSGKGMEYFTVTYKVATKTGTKDFYSYEVQSQKDKPFMIGHTVLTKEKKEAKGLKGNDIQFSVNQSCNPIFYEFEKLKCDCIIEAFDDFVKANKTKLKKTDKTAYIKDKYGPESDKAGQAREDPFTQYTIKCNYANKDGGNIINKKGEEMIAGEVSPYVKLFDYTTFEYKTGKDGKKKATCELLKTDEGENIHRDNAYTKLTRNSTIHKMCVQNTISAHGFGISFYDEIKSMVIEPAPPGDDTEFLSSLSPSVNDIDDPLAEEFAEQCNVSDNAPDEANADDEQNDVSDNNDQSNDNTDNTDNGDELDISSSSSSTPVEIKAAAKPKARGRK